MALPLYYKIYRDLQFKILTGVYQPGDMLPRELDLEKEYTTSRSPVRQALMALATEGLIERIPGKGTFVSKTNATSPWILSSGLTECYEKNWHQITHLTLSATVIQADAHVAEKLQIQVGTSVLHLVRVQSIAALPVVLIHGYMPPIYDFNVIQEAKHFSSWKALLETKFQKNIATLIETPDVELLCADDAKLLNLEPHHPTLCVERLAWDEFDHPLFYNRTYLHPNRWKYQVAFKQPLSFRP